MQSRVKAPVSVLILGFVEADPALYGIVSTALDTDVLKAAPHVVALAKFSSAASAAEQKTLKEANAIREAYKRYGCGSPGSA